MCVPAPLITNNARGTTTTAKMAGSNTALRIVCSVALSYATVHPLKKIDTTLMTANVRVERRSESVRSPTRG